LGRLASAKLDASVGAPGPHDFAVRRSGIVEHPFGTIKCRAGYRHFLVRGFNKVRGEWSLMALCYNFTRVLNILGFERFVCLHGSKDTRSSQIRSCSSPALHPARPGGILDTYRATARSQPTRTHSSRLINILAQPRRANQPACPP
jgi:hypothetical protein